MKTKNRQLVLILAIGLLCLVLFMLLKNQQPQIVSAGSMCDLSHQSCRYAEASSPLQYVIDLQKRPVELESLNEVVISFDALSDSTSLIINSISGKIQGINMQMGFIPIRFHYDEIFKKWRGTFMLGACIEPKMRWLINISFEYQLTSEVDNNINSNSHNLMHQYILTTEI